jgi:prevent-host-death family protein
MVTIRLPARFRSETGPLCCDREIRARVAAKAVFVQMERSQSQSLAGLISALLASMYLVRLVWRGLMANDANWQLQEAKSRFSEVVKKAREEGPQHVSVRGEPAVVIISEQEFAKLTSPRRSFVDFLLEGEPWPDDLVDAINDRSRDTGRDIAF